MVLYPLEFAECYLDSPFFRSNIQEYEEELERTDSQIKKLIKVGQDLALLALSMNNFFSFVLKYVLKFYLF